MPTDTLDSLVAERVMGWTYDGMERYSNPAMWRDEAGKLHRECSEWHPSRDMTCAYEIIHRLRGQRFSVRERFSRELVKLVNDEAPELGPGLGLAWPGALFWLTPRIICLAALAAVAEPEADHA